MSSASKKKKHGGHDEAHENHERWLITYADMITLLMVLFIVLFAIGQTDLAKFEKLKEGLGAGAAGQSVLDGGEGVLDGVVPAVVDLPAAVQAAAEAHERQEAAYAHEREALRHTSEDLAARLAAAGLSDAVRFRVEARGLVVTIVTDQVLFDVGAADLRQEGVHVLDSLALPLAQLPNPVTIEGHTDDTPIRGGRLYPSNWELSTSRATSVLRYLVDRHGLPVSRLSASGFADQRPVEPNDTPAHKAANRRVEIVIHSTVADPSPPAGPSPATGDHDAAATPGGTHQEQGEH